MKTTVLTLIAAAIAAPLFAAAPSQLEQQVGVEAGKYTVGQLVQAKAVIDGGDSEAEKARALDFILN